MSHNAPAVEPDAFPADHDAALDHQPGSPSDRCAAPAAHARYQHRDRVPLDRPCPATRPDRNQRHHPGPNCPPARTKVRRNDQQDTYHEPAERARRRETPAANRKRIRPRAIRRRSSTRTFGRLAAAVIAPRRQPQRPLANTIIAATATAERLPHSPATATTSPAWTPSPAARPRTAVMPTSALRRLCRRWDYANSGE
jgi:hypothetical protein